MNLTNPRLNQLLKTARKPVWIAAFLSIGFHGVLFAAGPSFSGLGGAALGGSDPNGEDRQVPLLELTPEEQSRLPDFSTPAYSPFPEGNDDLFSLFPPSGESLPLDSASPFGSSLSIPTPRLPSGFSTGISPYLGSTRSPISISPRRSPLPSIPRRSGLNGPAASADPDSEAETPTAAAPGSPDGEAADLMPEGNGSANGANGETAPLAEAPTPGQSSDLLARLEYNDAQTSADQVDIAKAAWRRSLREKLGDDVAEVEEPIVLPVTTPGRICMSPEPTDGLLGLVALPNEAGDGLTLVTSVLKSTGYALLNQRAEQALRGLEQQTDEEGGALEPNTLYQVVLDVDYDSQTCVSREALLQSRTADSDDSEAPTE
ncbi:MAG: hypothetical protein DCF17_09350 [Shackletoniella antarctica]|uniref:Uncharacterized protein n=1 Tax=Shackletoniella antarctica TaxID=268115 RepID=A0A2W4WAM7_9CYAN|nr:MAG: hypothetical protein DCF17_09350 [Shackletoniella antarctica]